MPTFLDSNEEEIPKDKEKKKKLETEIVIFRLHTFSNIYFC